ncbi:MAG TPA: hypothetical protein VD813_13695 [Pseudonocardia sp.]|nr:hypothetical protein [Pseudonocardia sp.]
MSRRALETGPAGRPVGRTGRAVRVFAVALALLVPAGVLFGLLWSRLGEEADRADQALRGVAYLQPVGALVSALADAEAAAARDTAPDGEAIRSAVDEVDAADTAATAEGDALGVSTRWADLREQALRIADERPVGIEAAARFGELAALGAELAEAVAGSATAAGDGRSDTAALADAASVQLPALVAASGRYVTAVSAAQPVDDVPPDPAAAGREAAARERVAVLAQDLDATLRRSVDTGSPATDQSLVARVGDYRSAVAALVPPDGFAGGVAGPADPERVRSQQQDLVRTAGDLQRAALAELAVRIEERQSGLTTLRAVAAVAGVSALAVAVGLLWFGLPRRPEAGVDDRDDALPDPLAPPQQSDVVMVDARSLLGPEENADELVRVGRAVRRRRGYEDDPA